MRITPTLCKAGLAVSVAAVVALAGTAADAAATTSTRLTLSGMPAKISYGQFQQTLQGLLETKVAAGQTPQPVTGASVQVIETEGDDGHKVSLGTGTTDANGRFSLPVTLTGPGSVWAVYSGDNTYVGTWNKADVARAATLPTKITLQGPASAPPGGTFLVTGQVTMQVPDGTWVPVPHIAVQDTYGRQFFGYTDTDGRFTFSGAAVVSNPPQACVFSEYTFAAYTCSDRLVTPFTSYPVQITHFYAMGTPQIPGYFSFFAEAAYRADDSGTLSPYQGPITLEYLPTDGRTWIRMASGTASGSYGEVQFKDLSGYLPGGKGVLAAGGLWKVQTPAHGPYQASTDNGEEITFPVDAPTWITGSKVISHGRQRYLIGYLNDDHTVGPVPQQNIKIYYQAAKNGPATYVGTVITGSDGKFTFKLTGRARGYYQAVFAGNAMPGGMNTVGYYLSSNGAVVYYR